ncbi:MAG: type II secretion system F family protein [Planctomycetaceae bacterium]|nr:type II secretion system F family protein [Planctomycetaceae bacterium]
MSDSSSSQQYPLKAREFIALNDEIASLLRAGIPLSVGLRGFASSVSGRLERYTRALAERLDMGQSLPEALKSIDQDIPPTYSAILEAGAESGRLADAVESLANYARQAEETRNQMTLAMIYPTLVLMMTWFLFYLSLVFFIPRMVQTLEAFDTGGTAWIQALQTLPREVRFLGWVPFVLLGVGLIWGLWSAGSRRHRGALDYGWTRWLPGVRRIVRYSQWSTFSHFASELMRYGVPETRALTLAAESTGQERMIADVRGWTRGTETGESLANTMQAGPAFSSFMVGVMKIGARQHVLPTTMAHLSEIYHRRTTSSSQRFQTVFPIAIVVLIAGTAVLLYSLALFLPLIELLTQLGSE